MPRSHYRLRLLLAALPLLGLVLVLLPSRLAAQQPTPLPPGGGQVVPLACEEGSNCTPQNALFVDPKGEIEPIRSPSSGSFTRLFTVTRTDGPASQPAFGFSCVGRNGVTCTSFSPSSAVLPLNQPVTVTVTQSGVWHGSLLGGQRDASGLQYKRNRFYDPATGAFTQEDPIGLAGGLNVYGYAGGDAINFSDPFGLCAEGDSVRTRVTVDCGGGREGKEEIWAQRVSNDEAEAILNGASRLTGGSAKFSPSDVQDAYAQVGERGGFYVFPERSESGRIVKTGAVTAAAVAKPYVAFRQDALNAIASGDLGREVGNRGINAANILGHEGAHLLGASEREAYALIWGFTR